MRTKSANEGEPLEPLWVDDDGVVVEPEFVAPEAAPVDAKTLARDYAAAFRAVLRERNEVRVQPPWNGPAVVAPIKPRAATFHSTFNRMIGLPPARLVGMHDWWRACVRDGRVRVTRRLSLEEPRPARAGRGGPVVGCAARGACGRSPSSSCSGRTSAGGRRSRSNPNGRCMSVVGTSAAGTACSTR